MTWIKTASMSKRWGRVLVGSCDGNSHSGNGCTFSWNRNNPQDEANAIYQQTREEWMKSYLPPSPEISGVAVAQNQA